MDKDLQGEEMPVILDILDAKDYFTTWHKRPQAALAWYYCGRVYLQRNEYDAAMASFKEAETLSDKTNNYELLASIYYYMGVMYTNQLSGDNTIEKLRLALDIMQTHPIEFKKEFELYNLMALSQMLVRENADSTIMCYRKALSFALIHQDSIRQSIASRHIGACYLIENNIDSARIYLYKSIQLDKNENATLYYNLAELYYAENNRDSVMHFFNLSLPLAKKGKNNILCSNLYRLLYQLEKNTGNYYQALEYQDIYMDYLSNILEDKSQNDILITETKYNYDQTQLQNKKLIIQRQYIAGSILFFLLILIATGFYVQWKYSRQKAHTLELENAALEAEHQMQSLKNLRNEVLSHIDILKQIALLREDKQLNDKGSYKHTHLERIHNIVYGNRIGYDWDVFFKSFQSSVLFREIFLQIHQMPAFEQLDTVNKQICYLACLDFSNAEMGILLGIALRGLEQRKTNIRKQLNMPPKMDFKLFFNIDEKYSWEAMAEKEQKQQ
ncbi:hypothetical protein FACS189413_09820 [Bacteroidia bacterium]|nr:hypothetical protein FACS189413_09820 [Bacteroidia bacterium]